MFVQMKIKLFFSSPTKLSQHKPYIYTSNHWFDVKSFCSSLAPAPSALCHKLSPWFPPKREYHNRRNRWHFPRTGSSSPIGRKNINSPKDVAFRVDLRLSYLHILQEELILMNRLMSHLWWRKWRKKIC